MLIRIKTKQLSNNKNPVLKIISSLTWKNVVGKYNLSADKRQAFLYETVKAITHLSYASANAERDQ